MFVKGYGCLSLAKNMGKNISKNLNGKYSPKLLAHTKQSGIDTLIAISRKVVQKAAKVAGSLIGNKNANRITKVSRSSLQNNSETITK